MFLRKMNNKIRIIRKFAVKEERVKLVSLNLELLKELKWLLELIEILVIGELIEVVEKNFVKFKLGKRFKKNCGII